MVHPRAERPGLAHRVLEYDRRVRLYGNSIQTIRTLPLQGVPQSETMLTLRDVYSSVAR